MKTSLLLTLLTTASLTYSASNILPAQNLMFHSIVSDTAVQELAVRYPEYAHWLADTDALLLLNFVHTTNKAVLIKFSADWCAPCRRLMPIVHDTASEYAQDVIVIEVNFDQADSLREMFNVHAIPTLLYYKNGVMVDRTFSVSKEVLQQKLEALIKRK